MQAQRTILHLLDNLGIGAAIVDGDGQIARQNDTYAATLDELGWLSNDDLSRIRTVTQEVSKHRLRKDTDWIRVLESKSGAPLIIQCFGGPDNDASGIKVLIVLAVDRYPTPRRSALRRLFGLSPAEANVGQLLSAGLSVAEIALRTKTTEHTVRAHLKHIFQKTNTRTQASLAHMLRRCSVLPCLSELMEDTAGPG
jgi:DNA-binding CsgD family transcriptional regulator